TGMPLARDPAVGIIQVQNEDSILFWTMQGIKPAQMDRLGQKFGQWLGKKDGSLARAQKAWGTAAHDKDDFATGKVGILIVWHLTQPQQGGMARRAADQLEFLAEMQRRFYADMADYYRKTLGCKQLLNASNWVTADPVKLNDVERWTYAALDVIAVNKYTGGGHTGPNNGRAHHPGHPLTNPARLTAPTG